VVLWCNFFLPASPFCASGWRSQSAREQKTVARGTISIYLSFFLSGRKNASEKERTHPCAPEPHKITAAAGEEKTNSVALIAEQRQPAAFAVAYHIAS